MKALLSGIASLPFLAGIAIAAQPVPLSDAQMDIISAGAVTETSGGLTLSQANGGGLRVPSNFLFFVNETDILNSGTVIVSESPVACTGCFLQNIGSENLIISAQFGPTAGAITAAPNLPTIGTIVP